jgi:murein DD-endopeptidase MepM/ murein hydrolase activator NlpD
MRTGGYRRRERAVELGNEPALSVDGSDAPLRDRRAVSVRWLTGTVLTGLTSVVLMGGALIVALDDNISIAAPSADADSELRASLDGDSGRGRKADRAQPLVETVTNRQVIQVSTVTRQGDRDLIRVRPFAKTTASLALRRGAGAVNIPPFDPLALFASQNVFSDRSATDSIYGAQVEGEVTIAMRDFPVGSALIDPDLTLSSAEVEAMVRDESRFRAGETAAFASPAPIDPARFDFALASPLDISDLGVRIVPENVSEFAKTEEPPLTSAGLPAVPGTGVGSLAAEQMVAARKGDTLLKLLVANSVEEPAAAELTAAARAELGFDDLTPGDKVRIAYGPHPDGGDGTEVLRVSFYRDGAHRGTVARNDAGRYIAAAEPVEDLPDVVEGIEGGGEEATVAAAGGLSLYESLYQTAYEQDIPEGLVGELVRMFSFDVDFNNRARPGDKLELFYALDEDGQPMAAPEVLYAALTVGGSERRLYRFRAQDDGSVDYYEESGKSAQKFLMRKPMSVGIYRSGFGMRRHPILGWVKAHTGVDWAAPTGTPIVASGNGVVEEAEWKSGYGRWVLIRHANGYETGYAHMSGIAKGIVPGVKVKQGQVVGFVGSTGLSTGPHLHYEVHINNRPVDPLRIRLPRGRELAGVTLTAFERERERIDALIGRAPAAANARVAQTN